MMKTRKTKIKLSLQTILVVGSVVYLFVVWAMNPTLTEMQLFLQEWKVYVFCVIGYILLELLD